MLYFNSTFEDTSVRLKFLSYYQVIEYYYVRANNILAKNKIIETQSQEGIDHVDIPKIIKQYNKYSKESEAIRLVLEKAVNVNEFKIWINENIQRVEYFTQNVDDLLSGLNINVLADDRSIISHLCRRIYSLRCSIVHSKADSDGITYIPNLNDIKLVNEIPLMSFIAAKVLESWGANNKHQCEEIL